MTHFDRNTAITKIADIIRTGRMSRRDLLRSLMACGLTMTAAGSVVSSATRVLAQTPKRGGSLRFAWSVHGPDDTLDPIGIGGTLDYLRGRMLYNNLVRFNDDLSISPELATEWEANSDATVWTFKLRKGVTFHDGKTMTADDVVYSMNRHVGENTKSKAKSLVGAVKSWSKVDTNTVKAELSVPHADLPVVLATFHFKIVQDGAQGDHFQNPQGTGPFKVKNFEPGIRMVGVRNENYWIDNRPYLDEIETFAITDGVARVNALRAGDVQVIGPLDPKAIPQIEGDANLDVLSIPSGAYFSVACMLDQAPGNNSDFVKGLKLLQRRDRVVSRVLKGHGTIANDQPIGSAYAEHCGTLAQTTYDLDKAKFHLKKSGVTSAEITAAEVYPGITDGCLMLQREAQKAGLDLQIKRVPTDGYWGAIYKKRPIYVTGANMRPTAHSMLSLLWTSGAAWNETNWSNERFDKLLELTRSELDQARRSEMFCEMQTMLNESDGHLIPAHRNYVDAKHKSVKGLSAVPLANVGGVEWPETVWLDN
ncbi:MAG: ABC transporter substrate-binding protein [Methyloligellaceae bacterium]